MQGPCLKKDNKENKGEQKRTKENKREQNNARAEK
jgi:hypothetical protein